MLTLIVSGRLWRNSLVMQDEETGSFWSHVTGGAMSGKLEGKKLSTVPVVQTTWGKWFKDHPDTKVLKKNKEIRSSHYEKYFKDPKRTGLFRTYWLQDRMAGKKLIIGIVRGPYALAVVDKKLKIGKLVQTKIGDDDVVVIRARDGGVRAFLAEMENATLKFQRKNKSYFDEQTKSQWDMEKGICVAGKLEGKTLESIQTTTAFWFAWSTFYPNTKVID